MCASASSTELTRTRSVSLSNRNRLLVDASPELMLVPVRSVHFLSTSRSIGNTPTWTLQIVIFYAYLPRKITEMDFVSFRK